MERKHIVLFNMYIQNCQNSKRVPQFKVTQAIYVYCKFNTAILFQNFVYSMTVK